MEKQRSTKRGSMDSGHTGFTFKSAKTGHPVLVRHKRGESRSDAIKRVTRKHSHEHRKIH